MEETEDISKIYYSITEVADMIGENASALRFWEKEFGDIATRKGAGGKRMYTEKDVEMVKTIHFLLKEKKLTIEGAKEYLQTRRNRAETELKTKETLNNLKNFLTYLKETL